MIPPFSLSPPSSFLPFITQPMINMADVANYFCSVNVGRSPVKVSFAAFLLQLQLRCSGGATVGDNLIAGLSWFDCL